MNDLISNDEREYLSSGYLLGYNQIMENNLCCGIEMLTQIKKSSARTSRWAWAYTLGVFDAVGDKGLDPKDYPILKDFCYT